MHWRRAALVLILAYAGFLRLYHLPTTPPGLYRDEAMDGNNALEALETHHFAVFYPEDNGREGLYVNVAAVFIGWFGNEPWALRLPAAIFGLLTVAGVYLLGAEWFGAWIGLAAAFLLATSFWHVSFSRMAFRAIAAPCWLTWSVYFLAAGMRRAQWRLVALAGVLYGVGFYTYLAYRATPLLVALLVRRAAPGVRRTFACGAAVAIAPLAFYFIVHPETFWERARIVSVFHHPHPALELLANTYRTARMFFRRGDLNWRHNIAYRAQLYGPVAALFALGVGTAAIRHCRDRKSGAAYAIPLAWLAVAALPVVFSDEVLPHALRSLLMTPAVFLVAALGAHALYGFLARRLRWRVLAAAQLLVVVWLAWEPYHSYFEVWAASARVPPAFDATAVDLARRLRLAPGDKTVYVPETPDLSAAAVMFLTASYTARGQRAHHIRYVPAPACPPGAPFCLVGGTPRYH